MDKMNDQSTETHTECPPVSPEQIAYARVLAVGLVVIAPVLLVTFIVHAAGWRTSYVPVEEMPRYWVMPVEEYVQQADVPRGWAWVGSVNYAEFTVYVGMVMLAGLSAAAYLRVLPILARQRKWSLMAIAVAELAVIALAACGTVSIGH